MALKLQQLRDPELHCPVEWSLPHVIGDSSLGLLDSSPCCECRHLCILVKQCVLSHGELFEAAVRWYGLGETFIFPSFWDLVAFGATLVKTQLLKPCYNCQKCEAVVTRTRWCWRRLPLNWTSCYRRMQHAICFEIRWLVSQGTTLCLLPVLTHPHLCRRTSSEWWNVHDGISTPTFPSLWLLPFLPYWFS